MPTNSSLHHLLPPHELLNDRRRHSANPPDSMVSLALGTPDAERNGKDGNSRRPKSARSARIKGKLKMVKDKQPTRPVRAKPPEPKPPETKQTMTDSPSPTDKPILRSDACDTTAANLKTVLLNTQPDQRKSTTDPPIMPSRQSVVTQSPGTLPWPRKEQPTLRSHFSASTSTSPPRSDKRPNQTIATTPSPTRRGKRGGKGRRGRDNQSQIQSPKDDDSRTTLGSGVTKGVEADREGALRSKKKKDADPPDKAVGVSAGSDLSLAGISINTVRPHSSHTSAGKGTFEQPDSDELSFGNTSDASLPDGAPFPNTQVADNSLNAPSDETNETVVGDKIPPKEAAAEEVTHTPPPRSRRTTTFSPAVAETPRQPTSRSTHDLSPTGTFSVLDDIGGISNYGNIHITSQSLKWLADPKGCLDDNTLRVLGYRSQRRLS